MTSRNKEASRLDRTALHPLLRCAFLALAPIFLAGCYTLHMTQCTIPDNPSNRVAASNIVAAVAVKHGFVEHPEQIDQTVLLASYNFHDAATKRPLNLDIFADAGTITASLTQTNKSKTRAESFLGVQRDLVQGFKEKFGSAAEINSYNEELQP